jgi:hypothetical protein
MLPPPVGGAIAFVTAVGAVLLASMQKRGVVCESCQGTEAMDAEAERQAAAEEKKADAKKLRAEIEADVVPNLERNLRVTIEDELRPRMAEELRAQFEEELRPQLEEQIRSDLERSIEARLRPEIEKQVKAQMAASSRVAQPMSAPSGGLGMGQRPPNVTPARAVQSPPVVTSRPPPNPHPPMAAAPAPAPAPSSGGAGFSPVGSVTDPHARAQRRARVIVSDIALYHKDLVAEAVRSSDPRRAMDNIWEEAVRSYNESVPEDVRRNTNYLVEAFDAFITQKRKDASA